MQGLIVLKKKKINIFECLTLKKASLIEGLPFTVKHYFPQGGCVIAQPFNGIYILNIFNILLPSGVPVCLC